MVAACSSKSPNAKEEKKTGWQLVWADEFDNTGKPDPTKWGYDVGGHGWGNNELQYYTEGANAQVGNGVLTIEARHENHEGSSYTSTRLVSKGKGDWTYGRFEIRAKLPWGRGTWPAIWMLPTEWTLGNGSWPDNGEIDIMEHVGYYPGKIHASIHTNAYNHAQNTQKSGSLSVLTAMSDFNTYTLEWSADSIKAFVNEHHYFSTPNENLGWEKWPFYKDFHLILNLAIGGTWGGAQGVDDAIFPQQLVVDFVRVYEWVE
ncbi:MAG: glycoside hydrolase family 16 protein [Calditrichaeota bacterium]|nr:MAG: glycoside hydrolase family 16 protein [Calditrichota bacterium]